MYFFAFGNDGWLTYQAVNVRTKKSGLFNQNMAGAKVPLANMFVDEKNNRVLYFTSNRDSYGIAGTAINDNGESGRPVTLSR